MRTQSNCAGQWDDASARYMRYMQYACSMLTLSPLLRLVQFVTTKTKKKIRENDIKMFKLGKL